MTMTMTMNTIDELETAREVATDVATRLRSALDELHGAGVIEGTWGPKLARRFEVAADRLDACAVWYGRQIERRRLTDDRPERGDA